MNRAFRALVVCVTIGLCGEPTRARSDDAGAPIRPSILLIIPDQLRAQALGCMGNPDVRTPNLDRLAAEGVLFRNTLANTPVCCPARANILTGKYAHKNGMIANDLRFRESETTLAELLTARGYRTGFIGKWHLDGGPRLPGFVPRGPRRQGFHFWAANECSHVPFAPVYFRDDPRPIAEHRFEAEVWTDLAIEFLRAAGTDPFFLVVSMGPPHDPYTAPARFMGLYDPARISVRPNWREGVPGAGRTEIAGYDAAVTAVDEQVGRLLQTIDKSARRDQTIVLVTSDHGDMLGSHGQRLKRKPWEESIRVPGLLRYPAKVKPGRVENALLTHVDLAPTLLGLCGLSVPRDMQGTDLSGLVRGSSTQGPKSAYFQIFVPFAGDGTPNPWRGVRTEQHMYARTKEGLWGLYDLANDPYESKDLADEPTQLPLRRRMEGLLDDWMRRTGDSWAMNSMEPVEDKGRLYRFKTFYTIDEYQAWAAEHPELAPRD